MHCWARYLFVVVVIALGTLSMLGACGQQGALYMPPPEGQAAPAKPGSAVPKVPTATTAPTAVQPPGSDGGLLSWPAARPAAGCAGASTAAGTCVGTGAQ